MSEEISSGPEAKGALPLLNLPPNDRRGPAHTLFGDQLTRHGHEQVRVKAH